MRHSYGINRTRGAWHRNGLGGELAGSDSVFAVHDGGKIARGRLKSIEREFLGSIKCLLVGRKRSDVGHKLSIRGSCACRDDGTRHLAFLVGKEQHTRIIVREVIDDHLHILIRIVDFLHSELDFTLIGLKIFFLICRNGTHPENVLTYCERGERIGSLGGEAA